MIVTEDRIINFKREFPEFANRAESIMYISGTGEIQLFYYNDLGDRVEMTDVIAVPSQDVITHGKNFDLMGEVEGTTAVAPLVLIMKGMA